MCARWIFLFLSVCWFSAIPMACQLFIFWEVLWLHKKRILVCYPIKFGIPIQLIKLINTCLDSVQSKVRIWNYLYFSLPTQNGLKPGDALSLQLFHCTPEYAIRKIQETNLGLDMNGTSQVVTYVNDVNLRGNQNSRKNVDILSTLLLHYNILLNSLHCVKSSL